MDIRLRGTLCRESAIHQAHSHFRDEPLAHGDVECRSDALAEVSLTVVVAEVDITSGTHADEPVAPEAVGLDPVFVVVIGHFFGGMHVLCMHRSHSRKGHGC